MRRLLTPSGFVLALICFVLPFATVSCAPSTYGHAKAGGTTTYNGVDLVIGGAPKITPPDFVAPAAAWKPDRLKPQPLAAGTALLLIAGAVTWLVLGVRRSRYPVAVAIAGLAVLLLLANQATVEHLLQVKLKAQVTLPPGKPASEFVHTGSGFGLALLTLATLLLGNLIGWIRRPKPARATPIPFESKRSQRARAEAAHAAKMSAQPVSLSRAPARSTGEFTPPAGTGHTPAPHAVSPHTPAPPVAPAYQDMTGPTMPDGTTAPHHPQPGVDPWPDAPV